MLGADLPAGGSIATWSPRSVVRRCEGLILSNGYDTWQDLETLASFGQDLLDRHDTGRTLEDLALDDLEYVLDRMKAREPYLETSFSRRVVNTQLRDGRHRELMRQQLM